MKMTTIGRHFQAPASSFFLFGPRGTGQSLRAFGEDYPEADLRLLYRGSEPLEIAGVRCLPCERYLLQMVPGRPLP